LRSSRMAPRRAGPYSCGILFGHRPGPELPMTRADPAGPGQPLSSSPAAPAPIRWPDGVTAAACLTFDMDAEAAVLTGGAGRGGGPAGRGVVGMSGGIGAG